MAVAIANGVGIAAQVGAQDGAAVRVGSRQFDHRNGRRNGLNGAGSRARELINLLAGGLDAVGFPHGLKRQLNTRAASDALKVVVFASCA
jgi:hypothetical protein